MSNTQLATHFTIIAQIQHPAPALHTPYDKDTCDNGTDSDETLEQNERFHSYHCSDNTTNTHNTLEDKYRILYALGSDTIQKFHVSAHLRQFSISTPYIFLLWRLSRFVNEPFRTRCQSQLRLILEFRHTTTPPVNIPLRLHIPDDAMFENIRKWMLGFTFFHRIHFPPLHKPRAPIIHIKNQTWGQVLFNFRRFLKWWYPDRTPTCTCNRFPSHIQQKKKNTLHIVAWASECFPDIPEFRHHAGSEVAPTWRIFHYQATEQFEKWLRKWRLPAHLQQYWQYFLNQQWKLFREQHGPTHRRQSQLRQLLSLFIATPADHFPNSLLLMCPVQYHILLQKKNFWRYNSISTVTSWCRRNYDKYSGECAFLD